MKKTGILFILLLALASCKEQFIDLVPEDSLSPDTFFQNDAQLQQAAVSAYVPLRGLLNNEYFTAEMRSDNAHYQPSPSNRGTANVFRENVADWNNDSNNDYVNNVYYNCYEGISRANVLIDRIPEAKNATAAGIAKAGGQAKFIRALNYFKLVRLFGGVPLYLKEVKKADDAFLPRADVQAVYDQIITDCKEAISELAVPARFPQTGEATKGSATVLLADVYITLKRYAEAEALLNTLPAMGYDLMANYEDVFRPANKNGRESLFEVQYQEGTAVGAQPNTLPFQFLPRTATTNLITGSPVSDTRSAGGWNKPTPDLIAAYEPGDKRLEASVAVAEGSYDASYFLVISANKNVTGYVPAAGKVGQQYIKKYIHAPFTAPLNSNDNFPVYRYAEALLLLAEAQNEQGKSPLAALNRVRTRAGLPPVTLADQATLRSAILKERRTELAFENKRFYDLQRSPAGLQIMQAYAAKAKTTYTLLPATAFDIQAYKFLFPIPNPERGLNPQLTQNPGYAF